MYMYMCSPKSQLALYVLVGGADNNIMKYPIMHTFSEYDVQDQLLLGP